MLYELPDSPGIHLIGPDEDAVWTALGVAAAGRHAVIIGDPTAPAQATVIAGTVADLAAWLDPFTGRIPAVLTGMLMVARAAGPATGSGGDEPTADVDQPTVTLLVTLPHTGIQVPDPTLRGTSLRQLSTEDGIALHRHSAARPHPGRDHP